MSEDELESLPAIARKAVKHLRAAQTAEGSALTDALRGVAEAFVAAREHFYTRDGEVDWRGRTHIYRAWVREQLGDAGVPDSERSRLLAAVRYHTGAVLRERLDDETLERYGLRSESPRERAVEQREQVAETLAFFSGGGRVTDPDDVISLARIVRAALARVDVAAIRALPAADKRRVREALAPVHEHHEEIVKAAGGRRK